MELLSKGDLRKLLELARAEYFKQLGMLTELQNNPDKSEIDCAIRCQKKLFDEYDRLCSRLVTLYLEAEKESNGN